MTRARLRPRAAFAPVACALTLAEGAAAQAPPTLRLPPPAGASIVQTLEVRDGDRESVHTVREVTSASLRWSWRLVEVLQGGDTVRQDFRYAELLADVATAVRWRAYHARGEPEESPGYTMHALSQSMYRRLRATGRDTFQVMSIDAPTGLVAGALGFSSVRANPVRWSGKVTVADAAPVPFPLLVNQQRVQVQALHLRARLVSRTRVWTPEFWILADESYPLILKWVGAYGEPTNVLQTTRVDFPAALPDVERTMATSCRAVLPGIYFAFNSAVLDDASERTLDAVAEMLKRHADWKVTLEGHTDSIGGALSNQQLSERRVAAVKERLVSRHGVEASRLGLVGFGSTRPREPNGSLEGRARNRRVELVRPC